MDPVWVNRRRIAGQTQGPLRGLTFAVKDLFDIAGDVTGCGNPDWAARQTAAIAHAPAVELLLAAGADGVGRVRCDEFAFGLSGENHWSGTPENPAAPERVPGGSSSGSAVAVACREADFSLGTDTAGSVRVPASNCGLWGWRPSHGSISLAGVSPLAPSFDTVGVFSHSADLLQRVAAVLLGGTAEPAAPVRWGYLPALWDLCDPAVQAALRPWQARLNAVPLDLPVTPNQLRLAFQTLQWAEIHSTWGQQVPSLHLGPRTARNFELAAGLDRRSLPQAIALRRELQQWLQTQLPRGTVLVLPTVPSPPPPCNSLGVDRTRDGYIPQVITLGALAGLGGLPQVTLPVAHVEAAPVGLSLVGARGEDLSLLAIAASLSR